MEILKKGSKGTEVKALQEALKTLGYSLGIYGVDGKFGSATEKALKKYQQEHNLPATGELDEETWGTIEIDLDIMQKEAASQPAPEKVAPATTYTNVMIGGASSDENKSARGGQPGNQTGKELKIQKWYNGNWHTVLRPKTPKLAEALAVQCEGACNNPNIGYDQSDRNTILAAAKAADWNLAKITTPCECDCSSLMSMCCICCGLPENDFYISRNLRTTKTITAACKKTNMFDILQSAEYLTSKDYLKRGDILVSNTHTCMVLQNGSKANKAPTEQNQSLIDKIKDLISPSAPVEGYTGIVTGGSVYVRSGPGKTNKPLYTVHRNDKLHIVEEKDGWGRIEADTPKWISLKYIKKV